MEALGITTARYPILFWRKGIRPFEQPLAVETVDIMPTLASLIGVPIAPGTIDGRCLDLAEGPGNDLPLALLGRRYQRLLRSSGGLRSGFSKRRYQPRIARSAGRSIRKVTPAASPTAAANVMHKAAAPPIPASCRCRIRAKPII
jgi:hypothetical protein